MIRFVPLFALAIIVGCKDGVAPLQGELYVLESIAGVKVPAPYAENVAFTQRIIADTIAFGAAGRGERRTVYEGDPDPSKTFRATTMFSYTRSGNQVEVNFDCPPTASCIAPPHLAGTITNTQLTFTMSRISRQPLTFTRLFGPD